MQKKMGVLAAAVWLVLASGIAHQAVAETNCPKNTNQISLGKYGSCTGNKAPNPGQIIAHIDVQSTPNLPAGVTLTCTSQVTLSTADCTKGSCGAIYDQKTVTSYPITSKSANADGQCPQSTKTPPDGCGLLGVVSLSTAGKAATLAATGSTLFDCTGYLSVNVLKCVAGNGGAYDYKFNIQMGANLFGGDGKVVGGFDGGKDNELGSNSCTQTITGTAPVGPTNQCAPTCSSGSTVNGGNGFTASCTQTTGTASNGLSISGLPISYMGTALTTATQCSMVGSSFFGSTGLNCAQASGQSCAQCALTSTGPGSSIAAVLVTTSGGSRCVLACQPNSYGYGSGVCQDPHFLAQGYNFNFTGIPEESYCILSDDNLHINAKIVGESPDAPPNTEGTQNGTWMDAIFLTFSKDGEEHSLAVNIDQDKDFEIIDCFDFELDGELLGIPSASTEHVFVSDTNPKVTITRRAGARAAAEVEIEGVALIHFDIYYDERIQLDPPGKYLNMYFKQLLLGPDVHGVLGQFFAKDAKSKKDALWEKLSPYDYDNRGLVDGGDEDYKTSAFAATDCPVARFGNAAAKADVSSASGDVSIRRMMLSKQTASLGPQLQQVDIKCGMEGGNMVCQ